VIELDPARRDRPFSIEIRDNPRRPCLRLELDCTAFGNKLKKGAEALVDAAVDLIKLKRAKSETVIDLRLVGKLNLDRIALEQSAAAAEIEKAARVQAVALDTSGLNVEATPGSGGGLFEGEGLTREMLEKSAIRSLVNEKNLWGLEGREQDFADLFYQLKEAVRAGKTGEELAVLIGQSPLVDEIQGALEDQERRET